VGFQTERRGEITPSRVTACERRKVKKGSTNGRTKKGEYNTPMGERKKQKSRGSGSGQRVIATQSGVGVSQVDPSKLSFLCRASDRFAKKRRPGL